MVIYAVGVSRPVVEGVSGEIRRLRETIEMLARAGKPVVVHCHERPKAKG
jgi:hypothetical protein